MNSNSIPRPVKMKPLSPRLTGDMTTVGFLFCFSIESSQGIGHVYKHPWESPATGDSSSRLESNTDHL